MFPNCSDKITLCKPTCVYVITILSYDIVPIAFYVDVLLKQGVHICMYEQVRTLVEESKVQSLRVLRTQRTLT